MEINPVKPVHFDPEQGRGQIANRHVGTIRHKDWFPIIDEVDEFSLNVLLKLADTALVEGNPATALEQYLRVLQFDPTNFRALYGKILAEGWRSPENLTETLGKIEVLLKSLPDTNKEVIIRLVGRDILALGQKVEADSLMTFLREITPGSYEAFAARMEQVLVLYQNTAALTPSHEGMLLAMIAAAERLLVSYRDQKTGKKFYPSEGIYEKGNSWLQKARELLKKKFPNRFERLLLYKKYKTCFVATVAWGDPMAEEVAAFRAFRDLYLRIYPVGRQFIIQYYRFGPIIAGVVAQRPVLKTAARMLLTPLFWGVRCLPGIRMSGTRRPELNDP
jgi:tetratricopeptide (TPR) repeat protein